jgi:hypothetical protein
MFDYEKYAISLTKKEEKKRKLRERMSMSNSEICVAIIKFNRLLEYNPGKIENGILFFEKLDINLDSIRRLFLRSPSLLPHLESNLERKINFIEKTIDITPEETKILL